MRPVTFVKCDIPGFPPLAHTQDLKVTLADIYAGKLSVDEAPEALKKLKKKKPPYTSFLVWLGVLKKSVHAPRHLLMIGLPLTILSGFGVGVLLFGGLAKHHKQALLIAAEGTGDTLALITWVLLGSAVIGHVAIQLTWQDVL